MSEVHPKDGTGEPVPQIDLQSALPNNPKPWWKTPHLVKLNFLLTVPMITGYLIGYDSSMLNGLQSVPVWIAGSSLLSTPVAIQC